MKTATVLKMSLWSFSLFDNSCFESVWSHKMLINKTISKSLFLLLEQKEEKKDLSVIYWASSAWWWTTMTFIVGANGGHCHRYVCSYSGCAHLCTVLFVIIYYIHSMESLCIPALCQCHCLNMFNIKFCLYLAHRRALLFVHEPLWCWSTWLLLLSLGRTLKHFMIHRSDRSCVSLVVCVRENEGGRGRVVEHVVRETVF